MFDAEKVVDDHNQILEEILRTRCAEKGALIGGAYGHLWSL